jgi:acyl-CoA hydrolase
VTIFVTLDDQGAPVKIKRWRPETEEDAVLEQYAKSLMELRKGIEEEETHLRRAMLL